MPWPASHVAGAGATAKTTRWKVQPYVGLLFAARCRRPCHTHERLLSVALCFCCCCHPRRRAEGDCFILAFHAPADAARYALAAQMDLLVG